MSIFDESRTMAANASSSSGGGADAEDSGLVHTIVFDQPQGLLPFSGVVLSPLTFLLSLSGSSSHNSLAPHHETPLPFLLSLSPFTFVLPLLFLLTRG